MKKVLSLITIVCCLYGFIGNAQPLPSKKEQYEFLQWYLKTKKFQALLDTAFQFSTTSLNINDIDRILSVNFKLNKITRSYIKRQIILTDTPIGLDSLNLKGVNWKKKSDLTKTMSCISMPVFSKDRRKVFISWIYYCGNLCGNEGIDVYNKTKSGGWKISDIHAFPITMF